MIIRMDLLEDVIFGNGKSIPGAEDISVLRDAQGFPYYKGSSMKGVFREALTQLVEWKSEDDHSIERLLGKSGISNCMEDERIGFSDFRVSRTLRQEVLKETTDPCEVLEMFTSLRTFTSIEDDGIVKEGSLRIARCVNKGIALFGEITCSHDDEETIKEVLGMIKWIGTMRNRGFGQVKLSVLKEGRS